MQRWEHREWYPASLSLAKIHNLEVELEKATGKATGDIKIEQKSLSPPDESPSSDGVREEKKSMSPKSKKKSTKKTKKTESKLDCNHCPLFKLYELEKFVDGEGTSRSS